jgi:SAM-dependent methyltransferase
MTVALVDVCRPSCTAYRQHEDRPISLRVNLQRWERVAPAIELPHSAPERLVAELNVPQSAVVAVFSPDPDPFAVPLAARLGAHGLVYSVELSDEINGRPPQRSSPGHIRIRHKENGRLPLPNESVDLALWAFAFRTLGHVGSMLTETRRVLRPGGRLAVVDWIRQEESFGPIRDDRVSAATCERCLAAGGFGLVGQRALNSSHYLIIGRRPLGDAGSAAWDSFTISFRPNQ